MAEAEDIIESLGLKLLAILGDPFRFFGRLFFMFFLFLNDFPSIPSMILSVKKSVELSVLSCR